MLAPITPHICHILWQHLGFAKAVIDAPWPKVDKSALKTDEVTYVIQVNGKKRGDITVATHSSEEDILELAKTSVISFLKDKTIQKSIVVSHRLLINFVVSN